MLFVRSTPIILLVALWTFCTAATIPQKSSSTLSFVKTTNPILRQHAAHVSVAQLRSSELQSVIDQMLSIAQGEQTDKTRRFMLGLAAPQVGISLRIIVVDMGLNKKPMQLGELTAFINPKIVWQSPEEIIDRDCCYSIDAPIAGIVSRAQSIRITALDRRENPVLIECSDVCAKVFQHEVDHLDGILFPDRIGKNGTLHWVEQEQYPAYRLLWRSWPARCPWETWCALTGTK